MFKIDNLHFMFFVYVLFIFRDLLFGVKNIYMYRKFSI